MGITAGFLTPQEVRNFENLPKLADSKVVDASVPSPLTTPKMEV